MVRATRPISCLTLRSRSGVPITPRKYFETTTLVATWDQTIWRAGRDPGPGSDPPGPGLAGDRPGQLEAARSPHLHLLAELLALRPLPGQTPVRPGHRSGRHPTYRMGRQPPLPLG